MHPLHGRMRLHPVVQLLLVAGWTTTAATAMAQPAPEATANSGAPASIQPVFDGWFVNPDGTYGLSFGYYSRNTDVAIDIPLGPDNFIEPAGFDGHQPTHFRPQPGDRGPGRGIRHWGVFTVTVPADFEDQEVRWTLHTNGETFSVPGHLRSPGYAIEPYRVSTSGVTPPVVRMEEGGAEGRGPSGVQGTPLSALVDVPLPLTISARDESAPPVVLNWFKHQGAGEVVFGAREVWVHSQSGLGSTTATFDEPGQYVLRVRATNQATEFDRFCCWTNGYVTVTVTAGEGGGAAGW
jgi:hypothetical protein